MPVDVRRIEPKDGNVDPIACIDEFENFTQLVKGRDVIAPERFENIACFHPNFISRAAGFDFDDEKPLALVEASVWLENCSNAGAHRILMQPHRYLTIRQEVVDDLLSPSGIFHLNMAQAVQGAHQA